MKAMMELLLRYGVVFALIIVDGAMLYYLVNGLVVQSGDVPMDPAVSAIISGLAGAITTALTMAVRDLYNPGGNGQPPVNNSTPTSAPPNT